MNKQEHIDYWIRTSEMDISSMETIHNAGKYTIALFMGHLALEKLLKAFWVKKIKEFYKCIAVQM
jgi:HEPN domain-containing protein